MGACAERRDRLSERVPLLITRRASRYEALDPKEAGEPQPGGLLRHARSLTLGSQAAPALVLRCACVERLGRLRAAAAATAEAGNGGFS